MTNCTAIFAALGIKCPPPKLFDAILGNNIKALTAVAETLITGDSRSISDFVRKAKKGDLGLITQNIIDSGERFTETSAGMSVVNFFARNLFGCDTC